MTIPPLAGVATYAGAARVGLGIETTVERLMRYAWIAKRTMEVALYWLNPTPEWEMKEALSLHAYLAADHAQSFRVRVSEMRSPMPNMDKSPDPRLDRFFDELLTASTTSEKLTALYGVLKPALLSAYRAHYDAANPLVDHPTRRVLRHLITEEEETVAWGASALAAVGEAPGFAAHLRAWLDTAGGVDGTAPPTGDLPASRVRAPFEPDYFPRRDDRFALQGNFLFPPHSVYQDGNASLEEKTLALMCKRALEMDVPEAMARMIAEAEGQPWGFYVDMCRQLWDEARHAMMGAVYFEHHGIDWRGTVALHPGFSIRLNRHMTPTESHAVLYAIEQGLMAATTGKKYEWKTAGEAGDPLAELFQDFDWADEVLHVHIGRNWGISRSGMNRKDFEEMGGNRFAESEAVLAAYADPEQQVDWWPEFIQKALRRASPAANGSMS